MSKEQLHELVNRLPESEVAPAARYLEFLIAHEEQPVYPEMLARINVARTHPAVGIPHEEIQWEFNV
jgi:metallophosphoesterase superfamily enzyme